MKQLRPRHSCRFIWLAALASAIVLSSAAATLPADWQHEQPFEVAAPGLVKLSIPIETLDAARPGLVDLRVYDDAGNELPYLVEHPAPAPDVVRNAKSFQTSLNPQETVITIETGFKQPIDTIGLGTPATDFIKSVVIEGSADGQHWQEIARGKPIFSQPDGTSELQLRIPPKMWPWLRLSVDDRRSAPIPFTGARIRAAPGESAPTEDVPVTIADRQENAGETRLTLNLPAANLGLSEVRIDSPDPLFTRRALLAVPLVTEDSIIERTVGYGAIYRLTIDGQPTSANLSVPIQASEVQSRKLLLRIENHDSPPLKITGVHAERRPVYLVFLAKQAGAHYLLSGNARCSKPQYDLAEFRANLQTVAVAPMKFSTIAENPAYHAPEALPEIQNNGTALDVSAWQYGKPVKISRDGPQQLELDLDVLSHSRDLTDLRLICNGKQVPYILDRTSITRSLTPAVTVTNDAKDPRVSRWMIKLPRARLPVTRLDCEVGTAVFQRDLLLYEESSDENGEKYQRVLGETTWTQTPNHAGKQFGLALATLPQGDTLYLETQNGDNAPITPSNLTLFYPVIRLLFKARAEDALFLYYGNPDASPPHYDLSLVANELVAANKSAASLGPEEPMKSSRPPKEVSEKGGVVFWGILALVVVVLLVVISRLLPKSGPQPPR